LVAAATVSDVLAVVSGAFTPPAWATFVKEPIVVGLAVALTVITTLPPIGIVAMSTSKLEAVKVTLPDVLTTFWIVSQAGKSLSVTVMPRASNVPSFVTVMVYVTGVTSLTLMEDGATDLDRPNTVEGEKVQLSVSLLKLLEFALVAK
jgi:hypothetical protein